jgi:hypothetical protein
MLKSQIFAIALFCSLAVSLKAQSNVPANPGTNGSELPIPSPKPLNGKNGIDGGDGIPALLTSVRQQERDIRRRLDEIDLSSKQQVVAAVYQDLPRGRKRPGWKREFTRSLEAAAQELSGVTESQIAEAIRGFRAEKKQLPEITVGPSRKTA